MESYLKSAHFFLEFMPVLVYISSTKTIKNVVCLFAHSDVVVAVCVCVRCTAKIC